MASSAPSASSASKIALALAVLFSSAPARAMTRERQAALDEVAWTDLRGKAEDAYMDGRMPEAIAAAEKALVIARRHFPNTDRKRAATLVSLATLYSESARGPEAEQLFLEAVPAIESSLGPADPFLAVALNRLATLCFDQSRFREAEPLLWRALKIIEASSGKEDGGVLPLLSNLGSVEMELGKPAIAAQVFGHALELAEDQQGEESERRLLMLGHWARALGAAGKAEAALKPAREYLKLTEKLRGKDSPKLAMALLLEAGLLHQLGRDEEAIPLQRRGVTVLRTRFGDDNGAVKSGRKLIVQMEKDAEAATPYAQLTDALVGLWDSLARRLAALKPAPAPEPSRPWKDLHEDALKAFAQGRFAAGLPLGRSAAEAVAADPKASPREIATVRHNLAALYRENAKLAEAEAEYLKALKIREALDPAEPADTAATCNNLAELYFEQGRFGAAEPMLLRSLKLKEQELGPGHAEVAGTLENLYLLYDAMGREAAAGQALERAVAIRAALAAKR